MIYALIKLRSHHNTLGFKSIWHPLYQTQNKIPLDYKTELMLIILAFLFGILCHPSCTMKIFINGI